MAVSASEAKPESLGSQTARSARWSVLSIANVVLLQLATTAALSRLLPPADFGVVAIGNVALRLVSYFADLGVGRALVQRDTVTDDTVRAGFWSSVITGSACVVLGFALSPVAGWLISDPRAISVMQGLSLSFLVASLSTTSLALLRRSHRFKAITVVESAGAVTYLFAASGMAAAGLGPWSLVLGMIAQRGVVALVAYALTRHPVGVTREWGLYRSLLTFGSKVSGLSLLEYGAQNLDTIAVGRQMDSTGLGFYSRGANLVTLPMWYLGSSISRVLLSSYSRLQHERERLASALKEVVGFVSLVGLLLGFWMAGASEQIIRLVLGPGWSSSVPVAAIAAIAASFQLISFMYGTVLESTAQVRLKAIVVGGQLAALAASILLLRSYGLVGFACAFLVSEITALVMYSVVTNDVRRGTVAAAFVMLVPGLVWGVATAAITFGIAQLGETLGVSLVVVFALQLLVGAAAGIVAVRTSSARSVAARVLGSGNSAVMRAIRSLLGINQDSVAQGSE